MKFAEITSFNAAFHRMLLRCPGTGLSPRASSSKTSRRAHRG